MAAMTQDGNTPDRSVAHARAWLQFVTACRAALENDRVSEDHPDVVRLREPVEERTGDGPDAQQVYQRFESAIYDDAAAYVTLWRRFDGLERERLQRFARIAMLEIRGLTGDRHPSQVFNRTALGIGGLVLATLTVWMTFVRGYSGEDVRPLIDLVRSDVVTASMWVGGLFVVTWYIVRMVRNRKQVATLSTIHRALELYLDD